METTLYRGHTEGLENVSKRGYPQVLLWGYVRVLNRLALRVFQMSSLRPLRMYGSCKGVPIYTQEEQGARSRNNKHDVEFKVAIQVEVILYFKHCILRHGDGSRQKLGGACNKRRQSHLTILSVDKDNR